MIARFAVAATAALVLTGVSCDKHSWEETRVLHGHGHGDHHGDAEHKDDHGAAKEEHHDTKAEGAAEKH